MRIGVHHFFKQKLRDMDFFNEKPIMPPSFLSFVVFLKDYCYMKFFTNIIHEHVDLINIYKMQLTKSG